MGVVPEAAPSLGCPLGTNMGTLIARGSLVAALLMLVGCATGFRGAPSPPFKLEVIEKSENFSNSEVMLNSLLQAKDKTERNAAMMPILSLIDIRYGDFRHNLEANKKHSSAITNVLSLAADVAGGLTNSIGVKDNYLALSTLLSGSELIYDKNYMYEQSLSALITQMDANRSAKLLEIHKAMLGRELEEYPAQVALVDVIEYHYAGSLLAATSAVQRDAGNTVEKNSELLRLLDDATAEQIVANRESAVLLDRVIASLTPGQYPVLASYLLGQGIDVGTPHTATSLRSGVKHLHRTKYRHDAAGLMDELSKLGIKTASTN